MKRKPDPAILDNESALKRTRSAMSDNGESRVTAASCTSFPEAISRIVGDYSANIERKDVVAALVGVRPITLCLSQNVNSLLSTFWSMGFLPSEHQWRSRDAMIDKEFLITDVEGCLFYLDQTDSNDCRIAVEVLVVKLRMPTMHSPSSLDDLRNTIGMLQGHLNNIKHVVFSIAEHSFCCFTLKNAFDNVTGFSPPVDHEQVLLQIIDDLGACWEENHSLTPQGLFAFYFKSEPKPASEMYLAKFVVLLSHPHSRALFQEEASKMRSNKIMWICHSKFRTNFPAADQDTLRFCDVIMFHGSFPRGLCFHDNPYVERIVIKCPYHPIDVQLPRPSDPLTDPTLLSALVELLEGIYTNPFHLTQLNNGYFPHLAHLSIIGGRVAGHLDSEKVPRLKTLFLDLGSEDDRSCSDVGPLVHERAQSLIHAGRPWQLVATQEPGGWSLASYEEPTANPQDELKDDTDHSHSLPLIKELMLVMESLNNAYEWQSKLNGDPSPEAAADDHNGCLLVWAPERVEKITVFSSSEWSMDVEFQPFQQVIPGRKRILSSLTCHSVSITVDGAGMPNLQSLDANHSWVTLSGAFSQLQKLSLRNATLCAPWQLEAPLLQSLHCDGLLQGQNLSLSLQLLPHLSSLQIDLYDEDVDVTLAPYSDQYALNHVSHLNLSVNQSQLPTCWNNDTMWHCETLTVNVCGMDPDDIESTPLPATLMLPPLPFVRKLTVSESNCHVLLNSEMPELTECSVPSLESLGPNLRCPALRLIRFIAELSESDTEHCLTPATYLAIGAQPRLVYFDFSGEVRKMTWNVNPNENEVPSMVKPL